MWDWIGKLQELRNSGQRMMLVTIIQSQGSTPREAGAKMLVLSDGSFFGTIGGGGVEKMALDQARKCLEEGISKKVEISLTEKNNMLCNGKMELFMELIYNNPHLYIFGAGHVGQAVCRVFSGTPFVIHLVDERKEWIESDRIPGEVNRHMKSHELFINNAVWSNENTYVAIMTHSAEADQDILEKVILNPSCYLGMVGSSNKWRMIKRNLVKAGIKEKEFSRVKCPIGLELGGKSPQEIAISIAAEVLSTYHGKENA
jgi:xanthine dehydrogenase accessory factor